MDLRSRVINLYLLLVNDPDGVCAPIDVQNELESMINEMNVKIEYNQKKLKFEVIENE